MGTDQETLLHLHSTTGVRVTYIIHKNSFSPLMKLWWTLQASVCLSFLAVPHSSVCKTKRKRRSTVGTPPRMDFCLFSHSFLFFCPQSCASMLQFLALFIKYHAWLSSLFSTFLKSSNFELLPVLIVRWLTKKWKQAANSTTFGWLQAFLINT